MRDTQEHHREPDTRTEESNSLATILGTPENEALGEGGRVCDWAEIFGCLWFCRYK